MKNKKIVVQGWDLGLNHSGYVELTNGELSNYWYITNLAGSANKSKKHGFRLILPKNDDKYIVDVFRLSTIKKFIIKNVIKNKPDFVGIEGYALGAKHGGYRLGEIGGIARMICWQKGIPFRLHDPLSIKMFITHDGTCQKDRIEEVVKKRWEVDFSKYNQPKSKNKKYKRNRTTSEDLADAFSIAKLVWTEIQLRSGLIKMQDLHEKEIRVFNRITKAYPVSILSRDWIKRNEKWML